MRGSDLSALCVLVLLAAFTACSDSTGPGADLVVTVSTSARAISPGQALQIHLEVRNTGERADSIVAPGPDCPLLWRIDGPGGVYAGPNGALAADGSHCTGLHPGPIHLGAGEAVGITYVWTGQRGSLGVDHDLPLGRYWIRAATQPAADIDRLIESKRVAVDLVASH